MRSVTSIVAQAFSLCLACCGLQAATLSYQIVGEESESWPQILSSIGLTVGPAASSVIVVPAGAVVPDSNWKQKVEQGSILVLEGDSALAKSFGFVPTDKRVSVRSVEDQRAPKLRMI